MEDRKQHIDQYFRQQLGDYTELPAPDVWAALEQRLDEKPRKRRVLWIWFTLLFMAAIGGSVYYYTLSSGKHPLAKPAPEKSIVSQRTIAATPPERIALPITQPAPNRRTAILKTTATAKTLTIPQAIPQHPITQPEPKQEITPSAGSDETTNIEPQHPKSPASKDPEAKEPERDILQLLPTAGKEKQPGAAPDEEAFLALAPSAGSKKNLPATPIPVASKTIDAATTPVQAPGNTETARDVYEVKNAIPEKETTIAQPDTAPLVKNSIRRFSAGLKTGYEFGTKPYHANSYVLSPYVQYNFNKRFGLLLQPAFKYSHSKAAVLAYGSYTQTTDSMKEILLQLTPNTGRIPTSQNQYMSYQKTYDSIFIKNELRNTRYWNLDLPLVLSYKVHKHFSIYAGPALHFTKVPKVATAKQGYSGLVLTDTLQMERKPMSADFDTLDIKEVFPQQGFDISQYNSSAFNNPTINPFKMGITFGLSYTFRQRFHFDILYRQTLSKMAYIHNEKIREILKQPYIRVMLGFDLLK